MQKTIIFIVTKPKLFFWRPDAKNRLCSKRLCFSKFILQNRFLDIIFVRFSLSQKSLGKKKYTDLYNKWLNLLKENSPQVRRYLVSNKV